MANRRIEDFGILADSQDDDLFLVSSGDKTFALRYSTLAAAIVQAVKETGLAVDPEYLGLEQDVMTDVVYPTYKGARSTNGLRLRVAGLSRGVEVHAVDEDENWTELTVHRSVPSGLFASKTTLKKVRVTRQGDVGATAFKGCTGMIELILEEGTETIGTEACRNCTSLVNVSLPSTAISIGASAFQSCALESVVIPAGVASMGTSAFSGNTKLGTVYWDPVDVTEVGSFSYPPFSGCTSLTTVFFAEGVKTIPANLFYKTNGSLGEVVIPKSAEVIGASAFNSAGISSVSIPAGVGTVGSSAFAGNTKLGTVYWDPVDVTEVGGLSYPPFKGSPALSNITFAENVKTIPAFLFYQANGAIEELVLPGGVEKIGDSAFYLAGVSGTVIVPARVKVVGGHAFAGNTALETVYWRPVDMESAGSLSYPPFNGCTGLTNFVFADGVTTIPAFLLYKSQAGIESIDIPAGVTKVGTYAFSGCSSLTTLRFTSVEYFGDCALAGTSALTALIVETTTVPTLAGTRVFQNSAIANGTGYIYVRDELVDAFKSATNWANFAAQIKPLSEYVED